MAEQYFVKRGEKISGPFGLEQLQKLLAQKKLKSNDLVGASQDGEWTRLSEVYKDIASGSFSLAATTSNASVAEKDWTVTQMDSMEFLVEGATYVNLFGAINDALKQDHKVTGAFERSGKLRGEGSSGFEFLIMVQPQDTSSTITIEISTPDGPVNFEAWFDPTTVGGWALFAGTGLFNAVVNDGAAHTLSTDIRLLLKNVFRCLGCVDRVEAIELDEQRELEEQKRVNEKVDKVADYGVRQVKGTTFVLLRLPLLAALFFLLWLGVLLLIAGIFSLLGIVKSDDSVVALLAMIVIGISFLTAFVWLFRKKAIPAWREFKGILQLGGIHSMSDAKSSTTKLAKQLAEQTTNAQKMQGAGFALIALGIVWFLFAMAMDTTVSTRMGSVHNIGLMQSQKNHMMLGGLILAGGVVLSVIGGKKK
jgi:hypothetical protein